jgi:sugar lactone lactonase YvrE
VTASFALRIPASLAVAVLAACGGNGATPVDAPAPTEPTIAVVSRFDPARGELPEGLTIVDGVPYVGMAPTSEVVRIDPVTGARSPFGTLPTVAPGTGFLTGITSGAADPGAIYAGLASFTPDVQAGVYRIGPTGGAATLVASHPDMAFPNGVAIDAARQLFVTDSAAGAVFRVSATGAVTPWARSELLAGDKDSSCAKAAGSGVSFDIGANGIVRLGDHWYVTNSDRGTIVRIAVTASGDAGAIAVVAGPDCDALGGADGIDSDGTSLIVAMNYQNELARVDDAGRVHAIASGGPLDFPASPAVSGADLYVTSFAFASAQAGGGAPSLVRVEGALAR